VASWEKIRANQNVDVIAVNPATSVEMRDAPIAAVGGAAAIENDDRRAQRRRSWPWNRRYS